MNGICCINKNKVIMCGEKMKQFSHLGAYGLIINNGQIVLVKKTGGPYAGKLDLPGGTIEFDEKTEQTLIRERTSYRNFLHDK